MSSEYYNIAERLTQMAKEIPDSIAIAEPLFQGKKPRRDHFGKREYAAVTFSELDQDSDRIAAVLQREGVKPGMRLALMVRQGIDFISLVFALYKTGATLVLIDPEQFHVRIAFPAVQDQCQQVFSFPHGIGTEGRLVQPFFKPENPQTKLDDPAAIIFTSGSTGVAKGVLYTYRMFKTQVEQISERLRIKPGGIDLVGFPFFGLFNAGMGTTAVIPDMDSTKPGSVDPKLFLEAADDWRITQSFGSPALWNRVVDYCLKNNRKIETLKRAVIAGAPVSFDLLRRFRQILPDDAEIITPYGATESLPLAAIESREVLEETCQKTKLGLGVCVGKFFDKPLEHRIVPVLDGPIRNLNDVKTMQQGEIGELLVSGPQCSPRYVTRTEANEYALVEGENGQMWRRVGDVGYFDEQDRFWFCGRKSHRVETAAGPMFSIPCEAISNESPKVFRSALASVPLSRDYVPPENLTERAKAFRNSWREPVMIVEPAPGKEPENEVEEEAFCSEILAILHQSPITASINRVFICEKFPVDVRHNAKINRELLTEWATAKLQGKTIPLANGPIKG